MASELQIKCFEDVGGWGFTFNDLDRSLSGFDGGTIRVPINSYGGSVAEGMAIFNALEGRKEKGDVVATSVIGYAYSMGSVLLQAGTKGYRSMPKNGYLLFHNVQTGAHGEGQLVESMGQAAQMMTEDLAKIYAENSNLSISEIRGMMNRTAIINSKQALEMGFVDHLTKGASFEASFNPQSRLDQYLSYHNITTDNKNNNTMALDKTPTSEEDAKKTLENAQGKESEPSPGPSKADQKMTELEARLEKMEQATAKGFSANSDAINKIADELGKAIGIISEKLSGESEAKQEAKRVAEQKAKEEAEAQNESKKKIDALAAQINKLKGISTGGEDGAESSALESLTPKTKTDNKIDDGGLFQSLLKGEYTSFN